MGVSVYWSLSVLCVFVCMCLCVGVWVSVRLNQSTSKKPHHVLELNKLDALLHKTCIRVLRLLEFGGSMEEGGGGEQVGQNLKRGGGRQYRGVRTPVPTMI